MFLSPPACWHKCVCVSPSVLDQKYARTCWVCRLVMCPCVVCSRVHAHAQHAAQCCAPPLSNIAASFSHMQAWQAGRVFCRPENGLFKVSDVATPRLCQRLRWRGARSGSMSRSAPYLSASCGALWPRTQVCCSGGGPGGSAERVAGVAGAPLLRTVVSGSAGGAVLLLLSKKMRRRRRRRGEGAGKLKEEQHIKDQEEERGVVADGMGLRGGVARQPASPACTPAVSYATVCATAIALGAAYPTNPVSTHAHAPSTWRL